MNSSHEMERLPVGALRCFEAFARLGDIAQAARELGVTPSAVSHQLRGLEELLGIRLTERRGRRLALTQEGRRYFEAVSPAFILLQRATQQIRRNRLPRRVTISALPLVANGWLLPRVGRFMARHPDVEIQIQYARYRNYSSDAADVSLRFGVGDWPGYTSERLFSGEAFPVANPVFIARHGPFGSDRDIGRAPLIHDGSTEQWASWLDRAGAPPSAPLRGIVCEDGLLTRTAMLAGLGIALTRPVLIEEELRAGLLVQLSARGVTDGQDYYLCVRADQEPLPIIRQLAAWLRATGGDDAAPPGAASRRHRASVRRVGATRQRPP
ncbi:LysR substrate-binding domain-containing protein [Roseomonas sp. CAU 1739]|uniref:LysR substrate-binding domain-containing protein n=1 Tax=Roseomonas sp. CAU 1739 TaxID=3140364 RepID=UPI00325AE806